MGLCYNSLLCTCVGVAGILMRKPCVPRRPGAMRPELGSTLSFHGPGTLFTPVDVSRDCVAAFPRCSGGAMHWCMRGSGRARVWGSRSLRMGPNSRSTLHVHPCMNASWLLTRHSTSIHHYISRTLLQQQLVLHPSPQHTCIPQSPRFCTRVLQNSLRPRATLLLGA
jgi:hypothetical protein